MGVGVSMRGVVSDGLGGVQHEGEGEVADPGEALGVPPVVGSDVTNDHCHEDARYAWAVQGCLSFSAGCGTIGP